MAIPQMRRNLSLVIEAASLARPLNTARSSVSFSISPHFPDETDISCGGNMLLL
jgi:hypothetical protein